MSSTISIPFSQSSHISYILSLDTKKDTFEYHATEHLRISGIYWALMAMDLMNNLNLMNKNDIIQYVLKCQGSNGGFSGSINHDTHILYTLSAIQILAIYDELDKIDSQKVIKFIVDLQQEDGSFKGI